MIVAPNGSTKEETSSLAPRFTAHSLLMGRVATLEVEENAKTIAGIMPLKNLMGLMPPIVLTVME